MTIEKNKIFYSNTFMDYIGDFLDKEGGIALVSIDKLVSIMNECQEKLVPKCMAITIISLSSADVQAKLCESGVWNILFQWLQDGLKNDTTCFIIEILRLYLILPISFGNLTSNSCPKLIKKLTKSGNPDIISIARNIVIKWKKIVEEKTLKDSLEVPAKKIKLDESNIKIEKYNSQKKIRTVKVMGSNLRTAGVEDTEIDSSKTTKKLVKKSEEKPDMEELHQKINVNADKRKVLEIHESKNFINSIMQTPIPPKKKKKRQEININKSASDISVNEDVTSDTNAKESPLPDANVVEKPKKRVSWAPTDSLQNIRYFDLDETERVNVLKASSIEEMKKKERMLERQNLSHKFNPDDIDEDAQAEKWYKPIMVSGIPENKIEVKSAEKAIQFERERKVLKVLYFQKEGIPFSPTEPENEAYDVKEPLIIPLEDVMTQKPVIKTTTASEVNSKLLIYTEKEGGNESHLTLRPDVANLLKSMTQSTPTPSQPENPAPNPDYNNPDAPQTRLKLINIIRSRYPDIDPEKLSSEEVCKLLEPMREQLIREGILSVPVTQNLSLPPPIFNNVVPPWFNEPRFPDVHFPDPRSQFPPQLPPHQQMMQQQRMPVMPFIPNMQCPMPPNIPFNNNVPQRHNRPVCRFMANNGYCRLGNNCGFSHILQDAPRQFNQNRH